MKYEVIKAESATEATVGSKFKVGDLVRVTKLSALANYDGTYTVSIEVEPVEVKNEP